MSMELFGRVMGGAGRALRLVYLQGWGEPLMNPNLADMIRSAKERSGAAVGLTTNGSLLEGDAAESLLEAGADIVGVSFAGACPETHNLLRRGCDFHRVVENTAQFVKKKRPDGERVRVVASYVMTRQNIGETPRFIELCRRMGIQEVVFNNLAYMPSEDLYATRAFRCHGEEPDGTSQDYEEARRLAEGAGIEMSAYGLTCNELATCPEAPLTTMFVGVDGSVSPCVFSNLPTRDSSVPRWFRGRPSEAGRLSFGNAGDEDLGGIWNEGGYREFRGAFERRTRAVMDAADLLVPALEPAGTELPEYCRTCYRILGV